MKKIFLCISILGCFSIIANDVLVCKSYKKVEGWDGSSTKDYVKFTSYIVDNKTLFKPQISGAFIADYSTTDSLAANKDNPKYPNTVKFFGLEDAWCWFGLIAPKNFSKKTRFKANIQYTCEDWGYHFEYISMSCFIE